MLVTSTYPERWTATRTAVNELGWFPITNYHQPPVCSSPSGVQSYTTIAYEIVEDLDGQVPDWMIMPASRGDGVWGVWSGFHNLHTAGVIAKLPRMCAVERHPSLSRALQRGIEQPEFITSEGEVPA